MGGGLRIRQLKGGENPKKIPLEPAVWMGKSGTDTETVRYGDPQGVGTSPRR